MFGDAIKRIEIELTTRCNLQCACCPLTYEKSYRDQDMALSRFIDLMRQLQPALHNHTYISLNGFGEFFEYPYYREVGAWLMEHKIAFTFCSNGVVMDHDFFCTVDCNAPVDDPITITVKKGKNYSTETAIESCKRLIRMNHRNRVAFQILYGDDAEFRAFCITHGYALTKIVTDNWAGYFRFHPKSAPRYGCDRFFPHPQFTINVTGDVSVCCKDFAARKGWVGNVFTTDLAAIMQSESYQSWLRDARKHRLRERALCQGCFRSGFTEGVPEVSADVAAVRIKS